jgi:uncharacterized protein
MKLNDEIRIAVPRERLYAALNDVEILKLAITGCEDLQKPSETEVTASVVAKVGPLNVRFEGIATLSDINPPESYMISGEGTGGAAGFASGSARIKLVEEGDETLLAYDIDVKIGGKLAQMGSRLMEGKAKKMAGEFFRRLEGIITDIIAAEATAEPSPSSEISSEVPLWAYGVAAGIGAAAVASWIFNV